MKKLNIKTETYELENGFRVEVQIGENEIDFWIYHKDYGVKMLTYGIGCKKDMGLIEMYKEINIETQFKTIKDMGLIEMYKEQYMDN